jgi:hypothetical protein
LRLDAGPAADWQPSDALVAALAKLLRALATTDSKTNTGRGGAAVSGQVR